MKFLRVLKILKSASARIAIVFHDVEPFPGTRLMDRVRRTVQLHTMRRALDAADLAIFTVPLHKNSWLPDPLRGPELPLRQFAGIENQALATEETLSSSTYCHFIPVGPNLPIPPVTDARHSERSDSAFSSAPQFDASGHAVEGPLFAPTIGVFSITGGQPGADETRVIISAVRHASQKLGKLRLSVFGRYAEFREADLCNGLRDVPVELFVEGVLSDEQVVERLRTCDVLLFVRGGISTRRSSAIAGIACGLPVIAFPGQETAPPITDAGVVLVSQYRPEQLNEALVRVLSDPVFRADLSARSHAAYQSYFSWPAIAARFAALLNSN